jgi:hypothetical protein
MKTIVDLTLHSESRVSVFDFEVILDAEKITLLGGEVTIDGTIYEGTLTIRSSGRYERDEDISILFDDDDLDDELLEKLEQLVLDQFYRLDTNNN